MDIAKINELVEQIYIFGKFLSIDDTKGIEHLKDLATALFAELDSTDD